MMTVEYDERQPVQARVLEVKNNEITCDAEKKFKTLFLRRLVRENHGGVIHQCGFAPKPQKLKPLNFYMGIYGEKKDNSNESSISEEDSSNILCTVGGNQLNTYDSMHCGDHLDLVSHFVAIPEESTGSNTDLTTGTKNGEEEESIISNHGQKNIRSKNRIEVSFALVENSSIMFQELNFDQNIYFSFFF